MNELFRLCNVWGRSGFQTGSDFIVKNVKMWSAKLLWLFTGGGGGCDVVCDDYTDVDESDNKISDD